MEEKDKEVLLGKLNMLKSYLKDIDFYKSQAEMIIRVCESCIDNMSEKEESK